MPEPAILVLELNYSALWYTADGSPTVPASGGCRERESREALNWEMTSIFDDTGGASYGGFIQMLCSVWVRMGRL